MRKNVVVVLVALAGISACGHPQESTNPRSSGDACSTMATLIIKNLQASNKHAVDEAEREMGRKLQVVLANRCTEDKWS